MEPGRMDARNCITLQAESVEYPAVLRCCEIDARPPVISVQGNLGLLEGKIIGFFCSVRCPGDAILKIYDLALALRNHNITLIGGFQSVMEKDIFYCVIQSFRDGSTIATDFQEVIFRKISAAFIFDLKYNGSVQRI